MGVSNLQNAAFYIVGKMFCLRGGTELRNLRPSQISRMNDPNQYVYNEYVSKTNNGTFKKFHVKSKVVPVVECPEAAERCPVFVFDKYFSKLPDEAFIFFRPLKQCQKSLLHHGIVEGKNTLDQKLKKMCHLAGINGNITNHSLRATAATQMFELGVPEKVI